MLQVIETYSASIISAVALAGSITASLHIIFTKRETRAAIGWLGLAWLVPIVGAILYAVLGINRIRRRAEQLREGLDTTKPPSPEKWVVSTDELTERLPDEHKHLGTLSRLQDTMGHNPLVRGNRVEPLFNGDEAYPAMLEAIEEADKSVTMASYIFDNDKIGGRFVETLKDARSRGVEVRVLVDAAGLRYSFPTVFKKLKRANIPAAKFLPTLIPPSLLTVNLRNHRKLMVVDGAVGFTGGINIRDAHIVDGNSKDPTRDLHFRLEGPVVNQLQTEFANDWQFATGEQLAGDLWFDSEESDGEVLARGIPDGPDENLDKLNWTLLGALSEAERSVRIMTPYFIPESVMIEALSICSMKGVELDLIVPDRSNLPFVDWASRGLLKPLLERNIRILLHPAPFNHAKLMVVDELWTLIGSSNWDPRSLRLNFEYNVECYNRELAESMNQWMGGQIEDSKRLTLDDYSNRPMMSQLRDGIARLASPYL